MSADRRYVAPMTAVMTAPPARPLRELLPHLVWEAVLLVAAIGSTI
ncbi:hypothetical protein GCM10010170_093760 [Dactylosporangium salmoneum]|uniref:Uncharacterized protein n=1 Tax=Dactylosporangium salmoneum TaxID=53361 RepID=A0ABN3HPY7_9ACTN